MPYISAVNIFPSARILCIAIFMALTATACQPDQDAEFVLIETELGDMVMRLHDDTPQHREHFLALVREGYYNGTVFHRAIPGFLVEGGLTPGRSDQELAPDMPALPPEISQTRVHTAGQVGAAPANDSFPAASHPLQFYIVTGKTVTSMDLAAAELDLINLHRAALYEEFQQSPHEPGDTDAFEQFAAHKLETQAIPEYNKEMIRSYMARGGAPQLDFRRTLFGEIVSGLHIVKQIERKPVDGDRLSQPLRIIRMQNITAHEARQRLKNSPPEI